MGSTNVQRKPRWGRGPQRYDSFAVFTTANTSAPTVVEQEGCSVARSAVGEFTLTCQDAPRGTTKYLVIATLESSTAAQTLLVTSNFASSTKAVKITVVGAGGNTAADTTGLTIHVYISARVAT